MKYYGRAESTAQRIIEAFQSGAVPKALAPVFIRRKDNVPCRSWSWGNQLLCVLNGTNDARGIKQWNDLGRLVKRGSKPFDILVPVSRKTIVADDQTNEEREAFYIVGFKTAPVFSIECTEGEELPPMDTSVTQWTNPLPLLDVARSWGLKIDSYDGQRSGASGKRARGSAAALGVESLSRSAHDLIRAADDRLGRMTEYGQHWRSETVTNLGGAILLEAIGNKQSSDIGCWEHIQSFAKEAKVEPVQACIIALRRTCDAVNLLLAEAGKLSLSQVTQPESVVQT